MKAKEFFNAHNLSETIEKLNQEVKAYPTDPQRRTFLFELLCFAGDHQRAARQLNVLSHQSATAEVGAHVYRGLLAAEEARQRLWSEGRQPHFLFPPPSYVHFHLEAVNCVREQRPDEARTLLEQAQHARPRLSGRCDEMPFADFQDSDDILASCLEGFVHDTYVWLPLEQVQHVELHPPKRLAICYGYQQPWTRMPAAWARSFSPYCMRGHTPSPMTASSSDG